eukprot:m51a1_g4143 putative isoprenylcysteine carboxyl methyltransferase (216) ;mRNA; r:224640-225287
MIQLHHVPWPEAVYVASFLARSAIRSSYAARNRRNVCASNHTDLLDSLVFGLMFAAESFVPMSYVIALCLLGHAGPLSLADVATVPAWASAAAAALQVPFLWLLWRSLADLGLNWSVVLRVREGHSLVTSGVYAAVRHPMYAAIWLSSLTQPLLVRNWVAGWTVVPAMAAMWLVRWNKEEAMMRKQFGKEYEDYCSRTPALIPSGLIGPSKRHTN